MFVRYRQVSHRDSYYLDPLVPKFSNGISIEVPLFS